jgi:hypothetical protein
MSFKSQSDDALPCFKIGDKIKRKDGTSFSNGSYTVTVEGFKYGNLWLKETQTHINKKTVELAEEDKKMVEEAHKYEEGKWYMWGGGECPLHPQDVVKVKVFNTINGCVEVYGVNTISKTWTHTYSSRVFAFKITKKYTPPVTKEMTVEEISKVLGYDVKIVKG